MVDSLLLVIKEAIYPVGLLEKFLFIYQEINSTPLTLRTMLYSVLELE